MTLSLSIIAAALTIICAIIFYFLIGKIINQEKTIFDLNNRLNLSDEEYIYLFNLNVELTDELESFKKKPKTIKIKTTI